MGLTKLIKPVAEYQQWQASDLSNGDIIDVYKSLGNRPAHSITIESLSGASTIRFNVGKKIYRQWGPNDPYVGSGMGANRPCPIMVAEIEEAKPDVIIEEASTQTWIAQELTVYDIKIISKSSGLKITVT
jgi:hypothetical protein